MNVKIIIGRNGDPDTVVLTDLSRWDWGAWLNRTEQAVKAMRGALNASRITQEGQAAHAWLKLCGVCDHKQFQDLERHLPQLRIPMSIANGRRCRKCGSKIWGKQALLTGLGSECRQGGNRAKKVARELRARFQAAQAVTQSVAV